MATIPKKAIEDLEKLQHSRDLGKLILHMDNELDQLQKNLIPTDNLSTMDPVAAQELLTSAINRVREDMRSKAEAMYQSELERRQDLAVSLSLANNPAIQSDDVVPVTHKMMPSLGPATSVKPKPRGIYGDLSEAERLERIQRSLSSKITGSGSSAKSQLKDLGLANTSTDGLRRERQLLHERYGVPKPRSANAAHPRKNERPVGRRVGGRVVHSRTSGPNTILPLANRVDPTLPPPKISDRDASQGLLALQTRGFVPKHVDLSPAFAQEPSPCLSGACEMHPPEERLVKQEIYSSPFGHNFENIRLDLLTLPHDPNPFPHSTGQMQSLEYQQHPERPESSRGSMKTETKISIPPPAATPEKDKHSVVARAKIATVELGLPETLRTDADTMDADPSVGAEDEEPMRGYNMLMDTYSLHQFIIRNGHVLTTPEYQSYCRKNQGPRWGAIFMIIRALEDICRKYVVPMAVVDGHVIAQMADDLHRPTLAELVGCIVNLDDVAPLLKIPGQRYAGPAGKTRGATCIQATWRMYKTRCRYLQLLQETACARVIQMSYRLFVNRKNMLKKTAEKQAHVETRFQQLQEQLVSRWKEMKTRRRVIVHVPSVSRSQRQRESIPNFSVRQNTHLARLCELAKDPNTEIVYVAPFQLPDDIRQYFAKLLQVGDAQSDMGEIGARYRVVHPENFHRMPETLSLTQLLLYSPRCLKRIKHFIRGTEAYLVPGDVGQEEKRLCVELGIGMLAPDPSLAMVYGSKSGAKRIFAAADVNVPPGGYDVYDSDIFYAKLANSILHYLQVPRWIFKIDDEFNGRGHAYFDVTHLTCHSHLLRESKENGDLTRDEITMEAARQEIEAELRKLLSSVVVIACPYVHPNWEEYLKAFTRYGGVIEACPTKVTGSPTVNILIEPTGELTIMSTHDQVFSPPYVAVGASCPQSSVPYAALSNATTAIAKVCVEKGLFGYFSIDYVAFTQKGQLRVWAVDFNPCLTLSAVSFWLVDFVVGGRFNAIKGGYFVKEAAGLKLPPVDRRAPQPDPEEIVEVPRYFVSCPYLYHPSLSTVQYNVFFNLCRMKGICFDLQENVGTAFYLHDSFASSCLGVICVGKTLFESFEAMGRCLHFIQLQAGVQRAPKSEEEADCNFLHIHSAIKFVVNSLQKK
eukprot:Rmarinus@m.15797